MLLDEIETLVADRQQMSLEANPIDVHRATDAALAGLDLLTRQHQNVLLIATTNFRRALDGALLSRADLIEEIGPPDASAREEIIREMLKNLAQHWSEVGHLAKHTKQFVEVSDGMDGRRLRKAFFSAIASSIDTARDPNKLKSSHILAALRAGGINKKEQHHEGKA